MLNKAASEKIPAFPYIGNREVQWGRFDFSDLRRMHFSQEEREKFSLRRGDLLVCEGGEVGRAALWQDDFECYFQKALHRLRPRDMRVTSEFMLHFMRFAAASGKLQDYTSQSSIAHLTQEKLAQVKVLLPAPGEQRKIAAILSSVDDAIDATQAVIDQLQVVKKAMMAELLTRGLPGRHTRFKMTEIGKIPEEWEVRELGRLCTRLTDGSHQAVKTTLDGEVPFLFVSCVRDGRIVWQNAGRIPRATYDQISRGREPKPGLILYTAVGSYGHAALVPEESGPFAFQRHLAYVLPDSAIVEPAFVASWLNGPWAKDHADRVAVGNAQKTVTLGKLNAFPVPCPNRDEQRAIADAISRLEERTESEVTNAEGLRALKGAIMSVLLTGEVRVKPDEEAK
jgi:type I restriction enzyme S subunit